MSDDINNDNDKDIRDDDELQQQDEDLAMDASPFGDVQKLVS